eukprot:EG_transcript_21979
MKLQMLWYSCSEFSLHRLEMPTQVYYFCQAFGKKIRFHPLLTPYKKAWNNNVQKYGAFWDPWPLLRHLAAVPFDALRNNLSHLRLQLILVFRLPVLLRSSDLSKMKRFASLLGFTHYVKIRRKGQKMSKGERMVYLPEIPQISPFHLLKEYVALTRDHCPQGGPVFLNLQPSFRGTEAETIASLTRSALE